MFAWSTMLDMPHRDFLGFVVETEDGYQVEDGYGGIICGPDRNLELVKQQAVDQGVTLVPADPSGTVTALRDHRRPRTWTHGLEGDQ